jgi:D-3-phosphoglycerate dehydrogenase
VEILLVDELLPEAVQWLEARHSVESRPGLASDPSALRKAIYNVRAVVVPRKVAVTRELLNFAPLLTAVARLHVNTDNTDFEACREHKVRVIQASTANLRSNTEYLLAALLLLYRRGIGTALRGQRQTEPVLGRELNGSVVGILGLAPTAQTLALTLRGLGAKLIGYDPAVHHSAPIWERLQVQPVSAKDLMANADAVSLQVLYASRYRGFINDQMLAHCKRGQLWVGISRSSLFDAAALAKALGDGRIDACMLDGAEPGFASEGSPLADLKNLYLTPRMASHTREARMRASWYVAHRIHETLTAPPTSTMGELVSEPTPLSDWTPPASEDPKRFDV